ncbi:PLP-dependent aminotransferase family protein [Chitinivorax sp. B]|uniref:aminotransferase-like domain-containing protein n=1 Tax=Chitinivorax sp. B TaxID=2502235 RepID=UPI0010F55C58|nr:PLP-dependent aminotransferase family protein [Chitinivorax sp. B]
MNAPTLLPRYAQLADELTACIRGGSLRPGDKLPSVRTLCSLHGVSPATVTHALHLLEDAGLIEARPRAGFYVKRQIQVRPLPQQLSGDYHSQPRLVELSSKRQRLLEFVHPTHCDWLGLANLSPSLFPNQLVQKFMTYQARRDPTLLSRYVFDAGDEQLRQQIARRGVEAGCVWQPDDIIITNGVVDALGLSLRLLTKPGDIVAIAAPSSLPLQEQLETLSRRALEIPAHPCDGISLDALATALEQQTIAACVVSANFASPTGSLMSDDSKRRLVELLESHGVPLIEDDTYGEFYSGEQRPKPCKAFDRSGNVILCSELSITLAPGLGLGYIVAGRYRLGLQALKPATMDGVPLLTQRTYAAFMESGHYEPHLRRLRRQLAEQLNALRAAVCEYFPAETGVSCAAGGYLLWVELPKQIDAAELNQQAARLGSSCAPGALFTLGDGLHNCLRLNAGHVFSPKIEEAVRTLGQLAQQVLDTQRPNDE